MISKERLEELVKKGATIYEAKYGNINSVDFSKNKVRWFCRDCITLEPSLVERYGNHKYYKNLFETKEEAEEYLKYGNITRTEKFPYVSWKEFCEGKRMRFDGKNGSCYCCELEYIKERFVVIYKPLLDGCIFREPLTRENYHKALDICVKLWEGEE